MRHKQYRQCAFRRMLRCTLASIISAMLAITYVAGDIADVVPGLLTTQQIHEQPTVALARGLIATQPLAGVINADIDVDREAAQALVDTLVARLDGSAIASVSVDLVSGERVAQYRADTALEPASTLKTLTAFAAASRLDMASSLDTHVYVAVDGSDSGTADLVLQGHGDMLLGAQKSDSEHVDGRAGLATLAEQTAAALQARGISSVSLLYDTSLFGQVRSPSRIEENNADSLYYTGVSSMAIDGGRLRTYALDDIDIDTYLDYPTLSGTTEQDTANAFARLLAASGIVVTGAPVGVDGVEGLPSAEEAIRALAVGGDGGGVNDEDGDGASNGVADGDGASKGSINVESESNTYQLIASVQSAPLNEVMAYMLRRSDNTIAEEFGRLLAIALGYDNSPQGATAAVQSILHDAGIDTSSLVMADCSGLSPGSLVTSATLSAVLQYQIAHNTAIAASEGLSLAGIVGTAANRLNDGNDAGLVRVKTGSLTGTTSMSGIINAHGGAVLTFAVVVNQTSDSAAARAVIDDFVEGLVDL